MKGNLKRPDPLTGICSLAEPQFEPGERIKTTIDNYGAGYILRKSPIQYSALTRYEIQLDNGRTIALTSQYIRRMEDIERAKLERPHGSPPSFSPAGNC